MIIEGLRNKPIDDRRADVTDKASGVGFKMPDYESIASFVRAPTKEEGTEILPDDRGYLSINHPKYQKLGEDKGYKQHEHRLKKTSWSHEAMIDRMLEDPTLTQRQLAVEFQVSESWLSTIVGSDVFQAALAKRRDDLMDPALVASLEERFKGAINLSLNVIMEKLEISRNTDLAIKTLDISSKAVGFGARTNGNTQNNQFIIQLPPKSASSADWNAEHNPRTMKQLPSSES